MGMLHWESGVPPLRCKGLYFAKSSEDLIFQYMLQGVDDTFECRKLNPVSENHIDFSNKFLFVGRNLNEEEIKAALIEWK